MERAALKKNLIHIKIYAPKAEFKHQSSSLIFFLSNYQFFFIVTMYDLTVSFSFSFESS